MSDSAESAVQAAVYGALKGDDALSAMPVEGKIFDLVPSTIAYPWIRVGEMTAVPFDTQDSAGQEHTVTIHSWSQYLGHKEVKEIMASIYSVLHNAVLTVVGHQTVLCMFEFSQVFDDPDGITHHGVQRFRIITEDN